MALRSRRERCKAMLATLEQTGEDQISLTDPDSRAELAKILCGWAAARL